MTPRIEKLRELAGKAYDAATHVSNAMAEKYPLGADFERYQDDIREMLAFLNEGDEFPALLDLVERQHEALKKQSEASDLFLDETGEVLKAYEAFQRSGG